MPSEARVVARLKRSLLTVGLLGEKPQRILVDADGAFINSEWGAQLEPTARVVIGGGRPDVLCSFQRDEGTIVAGFEVKAKAADAAQGMAQASKYRQGVHMSWLALPGDPDKLLRDAVPTARDLGIGLLVLDPDEQWHPVHRPPDPRPHPASLLPTIGALEGVPLARKLQLNHPLNYLVVPLVAQRRTPGESLAAAMTRLCPNLEAEGSRRAAMVGAQSLRLSDADGTPTMLGESVADLLPALGFDFASTIPRRPRLAEVEPALGAVARMVLLQQAAVRLIVRVLADAGQPMTFPELAAEAVRREPTLGRALCLLDQGVAELGTSLPGEAWNPSTVHKLKQCLWHAGILREPKHPSAGKAGSAYQPAQDVWGLVTR